jgi:protease-4
MNHSAPGLLGPGEHPVSKFVEQLDAARRDDNVKGLLLRINSPGGSVTASEIMHSELQRFRSSGKPVIAMMMDVAASGGYYISCACDEILALPTTVTGSVGVIMQMVNFTGTLGKIGMTTDAITSGPNKDAGSPFRPMDADERAIFQTLVDGLYGQFVDVVVEGRPALSRERILELADGRVYNADQALEAGLIDRVCTLREGLARLKEMAGVERCRVVTYQRQGRWHPNIYATIPQGDQPHHTATLIDLGLPSWMRPGAAQFMYLWAPGRL